MGLEKREEAQKMPAEWRRLKSDAERAFAALAEVKATGLALKAKMQADADTYDASDVADMQGLIDWYVAEAAKL